MKRYLGYFMVVVAIAPVAIFLGIHEIAFFSSTFSEDNQALAPLGYMLTGGGVFVWIGIMLWNAKTGMQKAISFTMIIVCTIGSLAAAVFNMYANTMYENGFKLTQSEVRTMTLVIGILAVSHMIALILHLAGEQIVQAWKDDDKDGTPNWLDKDSRPNKGQNQFQKGSQNNLPQPMNQNASVVEFAALREKAERLEKELAAVKADPTKLGEKEERHATI